MEMKSWALAYLHLAPKSFGELRIPEYWAALQVYLDQQDGNRRYVGELIRGATLRLWNTQVGQKFRISDVTKFWSMPWDDTPGESVSSMSDEERTKNAQEFLSFLNNDGE